MKLLLSSLLGLAVLVSSGLTATDAFAGPDPPGNAYGFYGDPPGQGHGRAVPIPGSLLLFGAGFAGLVGWQWIVDRRRKDDTG